MVQYRRIAIYYFSGTGNAKQIAYWIAELAQKRDIECQTINIAKVVTASTLTTDPDALIIFISPIHGFNYPKIMLKFIRQFPKGENNIVLMNTRAGMKIGRYVTPGLTGIAFMLSSILLKTKGYHIKGQVPFDMPSNWISIHPALNEKTVMFICKKNHERLEKHCNKIFAGKPDFYAYRDLIQDVLIAPVSFLYYTAGRFAIAKSFYASYACDNCGLCIKSCPVKAINLLNARPYWTFKCESCMKCMNSCPKNAIETAHGLFVAISFISSALTTLILYKLSGISNHAGYIRLVPFTIVFIACLWMFYRLQQLLLRNSLAAKIIAFTSLTHYKFWGRYKIILKR